ncbi:MAG: hypothetical protein ACI9TI_001612 [Natronomonas sp.]|jgi:hypothetical protein
MCHHHMPRDRSETERTEETPSFLNEETSAETELLTDGGDDPEEDDA